MIVQTTVTTTHLNLEAELQSRLGASGVAVVCTGVDGDPAGLWPEEQIAVAHAIPRRQREFAAGRHAARTAMRRLDRPARAIPSHPDRSPCWPEDLIGSISHTTDVCIAVVGTRDRWTSIGIDIESKPGVDEFMWDIICTPDERQQIRAQRPSTRALLATRVFVAKEAFYKWHYPQRRTLLEFQDVSVQWIPGGADFRVLLHGAAGHDRLADCTGHVFSFNGGVVAYCASRAHMGPASLAEHVVSCNLENPA
ncbi:4'-phosphopantetheinyl transferase family protein [Hydrogenophaga sp.]|uniref:4'-phosphopantetheinyl transferase family protein n=1 Tax=Hydrogenophaga sp. TaxID=1904254 RepID=UPI003F730E07